MHEENFFLEFTLKIYDSNETTLYFQEFFNGNFPHSLIKLQ